MPNNTAEAILMDGNNLQGAARVGAGLRGVRERLGWRLPDVAAELRIRTPYLEAIERGDLAALPGPAYQIGFIRSYSQILGLDAEEILTRFRIEGSMGNTPKAELSFLAPVPDRAVPKGAIVLLGVVLVLVGYGLWYRHTEQERRLAEAIPSVPAKLAPLALPPKPTPPPAKPAAPVATQAAAAPPAAAAPVPPAQPIATPTPPPGEVILATGDTWIEVRDATGNILFSKVLHAGDSWPVPDEAGLTLTTGNAGGTEIETGGKAGAPLGAAGFVLHDYALTPPAANNAN